MFPVPVGGEYSKLRIHTMYRAKKLAVALCEFIGRDCGFGWYVMIGKLPKSEVSSSIEGTGVVRAL